MHGHVVAGEFKEHGRGEVREFGGELGRLEWRDRFLFLCTCGEVELLGERGWAVRASPGSEGGKKEAAAA